MARISRLMKFMEKFEVLKFTKMEMTLYVIDTVVATSNDYLFIYNNNYIDET